MLKGLLFDLDGVIVDNAEQHVRAFDIFLKRYGVNRTFTPDLFGRRNEDIFNILMPEAVVEKDWRILSAEKEAVYREISRSELGPVKGLITLLTNAKQSGIACGIGSSACRENVEFCIDICNIDNLIDAYCCEQDVTIGKPEPEVYLKTAARLGVKAEECVVFEDATAGVTAGKRAGCKVVALTTSSPREVLEQTEADLIIDNFNDISLDILRRLFE